MPYSIIGEGDVSLTDVANKQKNFGQPPSWPRQVGTVSGLFEALKSLRVQRTSPVTREARGGALHAQTADFLLHHCQK